MLPSSLFLRADYECRFQVQVIYQRSTSRRNWLVQTYSGSKILGLQPFANHSPLAGNLLWGMLENRDFSLVTQSEFFGTTRTAACQACLSITNSWSLFKLMSIELVMPSNHLILCHPLFLLPSIFPSIRVFFSESVLCIRWPKYWSFSFNINLSNEYSGQVFLGLTGLISLQSKGLSRVLSNTTVQTHQLFSTQLSLWSNSDIHTWQLDKP